MMTIHPNVSVIIPYYNRRKQLTAALQSLLTERDFILEVIIVDDASDEPLSLVDLPDLGIKLIIITRLANGGPAAARSEGVKRAQGDLIAFLDSDDVWLPGKLAAQVQHFTGRLNSLLAVATGWQDYNGPDLPSNCRVPVAAKDVNSFSAGCWFCPGSTVVVTKTSFETVGDFDTGLRRLEDYDWFLRFALAGGALEVCSNIGAIIRSSGFSSQSGIKADIARIETNWAANKQFANDPKLRRRQKAWLLLAQASIARNAGSPLHSLAYLAASWAALPRTRVQLARWWRHSPEHVSKSQARRLLGLL